MPLVDLGPVPTKKKATGLIDLGPAPTPITEALTAVEEPTEERPRFEAAPEPGIGQRLKDYFREPQMPVAYDLPEGRKYRTLPPTREEQPLRSLAELGAYGLGEYGVGRALYTPELITERPVEKLVAPISAAEPTPKEKRIGESLKFIGGLRTAGQILGPVIATFPTASQQAIIGGAGVFGLRNITEQLANWARTGKAPSLEAFAKETALGALFGTAEVGLRGFVGFVKGLGNLKKGNVSWTNIKKPQDVADAIKHFQKTGDKSKWEAIRVKYAGITEKGAARIKARAEAIPSAEAKVKEFGKFPLARAGVPVQPTPGRPVARISPEAEGIKAPLKPTEAKIAAFKTGEAVEITTDGGKTWFKRKVASGLNPLTKKPIQPVVEIGGTVFADGKARTMVNLQGAKKGEIDSVEISNVRKPVAPVAEVAKPKLVDLGAAKEVKAKEQNFTQFATEHDYPSDYDITDHSQLSPSGRRTKRGEVVAMKDLQERINQNRQAHKEYREAILAGKIIDPSGKVTKEKLLAAQTEAAQKKVEGRLAQIETQIRFLSDVGRSKRGIRPSYQKQIDALRAERESLRAKPPKAPEVKAVEVKTANELKKILNRDTRPQGDLKRGLSYYRPILEGLPDKELKNMLEWTRNASRTKWMARFFKDEVAAALRKRGVQPERPIAEAIKAEKIEKKVPGAEVEAKPGPAKTLETIRAEGEKKPDLLIVKPTSEPTKKIIPAKGKKILREDLEDKDKTITFTDMGGNLGVKGKSVYNIKTQKVMFDMPSSVAARKAVTTLKESGINFNRPNEEIQKVFDEWLEKNGIVPVMKKGQTDIEKAMSRGERKEAIIDFLTGRGKELELEDYLKVFPKLKKPGVEQHLNQIQSWLKGFAQTVPEFTLNPTFTFEKKSGQLVFKDKYRFAFYPEHFGLDAEQLKDGQTIRFDLESFGIKKPTKAALRKAEPFLGEPKVLGRVTKKPTPSALWGEPKRKPRKPTKAEEEYYKALGDIETGVKKEVPGGITISRVTEKDVERAARLGKKAGQKAWTVEREILARGEKGLTKETVDIQKAVKIIRGVFAVPKGKPGFVDITPIVKAGKALVGDIEIEPSLEVESGAFNKHLNYFQGRQLPKGSQVRKIQKQMQVVNGQRLAGTITAKEANKKIQQLKKVLFETAKKEGIALRMTKGGKVSVAVRKAGTYVPVEFAEYKKFKDISPVFGGGQDITRAIQQMDGSLTVKQKLKEPGQAGQLEQNVLWPTRDMSLQKLEWQKEKAAELKGLLKVRKKSKGDKQINLVLEQIASQDRNVPIKKILSNKTLRSMASPDVIKQAIKLREFYDNLIDEQNIARKVRGQKEIAYRRNYSPHILRDATIWEQVMMMGKKAEDIFAAKADLPDYIRPNKPFNPREMARKGGIPYEKRVISARELAEIYLVTASQDIFNTSIIQNHKAFIQQLEAMGYGKSANYLADWTAEAYAGVKPRLDRVVGLPAKAQKSALWFNRLRNMAVFPLNFAWNTVVQPSSLALTIGRYGTPNTLQGFLQWLVPSVRRHTAKNYYSYVIKASKQGKITKQDARNLIGSDVKLKMTPGEMIENAGGFITNQIEKLLTGTSIRAAHIHGKKRGLTGEALRNYASDGGAKTQSMYNDEDKPALLRNLTVKTAAPYQTFAYEVVNTAREWYGRTGTPPDTKLYRLWTVLRFLAAATVFAMIGKKLANRDVWSWKRPPIPFAEFWLSPIIRTFSKEYVGGSASGLTSPVGTAQKVAKGIDDVLETGNWRKLRNELIKYGPGIFGIPGGVQMSRTVDAIISYSQGGVRDRRGKLIFKMEDPQDLAQGIYSGVWTTKGGREVIERRQGKKPVGARKARLERERGSTPKRGQEGTRKKRMEREKVMLRQ